MFSAVDKQAGSIQAVLLEMLSNKWIANFFSFEATHFEEALRAQLDQAPQLSETLSTIGRLIRNPLLRFQQIAELKEQISCGLQATEIQSKEFEGVSKTASKLMHGLMTQVGIEQATSSRLQGFKELEAKYLAGIDPWYTFMVLVSKNIKTFSDGYLLLFNQHVFQDSSRRDELLRFHRAPFPLGWDFERLLEFQVLNLRWKEQTQEWYSIIGTNKATDATQQQTSVFVSPGLEVQLDTAVVPPPSIPANVLNSKQLESFAKAVTAYFHSRSPAVQV